MTIYPRDIVRVVLEVEELPDRNNATRVHFIGVFKNIEDIPPMKYQYRNIVSTWFNVAHDVNAFYIPNAGTGG